MNEDVGGVGSEPSFQLPHRVGAGIREANADAVRRLVDIVDPGNADCSAGLFDGHVEDFEENFQGWCRFKQIEGNQGGGDVTDSLAAGAVKAQTQAVHLEGVGWLS